MKIIDSRNDYYDNITGYYSKYPVYVRKEESHYLGDYIKFFTKRDRERILDISDSVYKLCGIGDPYIVGVCGDLYLVVLTSRSDGINIKIKSFVNMNDIKRSCGDDIVELCDECPCSHINHYTPRQSICVHAKKIHLWNDIVANNTDFIRSLFIKAGCPIFSIQIKYSKVFIKNPILKHIGFQSVIHPYDMYQKIEMFLGNELVKEKKIPEFSDDLKRHAHGMDSYSFKRRPQKRK